DSSLIQDGFQLYHHAFFFTRKGSWTVVQQGMNETAGTARRYHWHSANVKDLVDEPHSGIVSAGKGKSVMNLTAHTSSKTRGLSTELVNQNFETLMKDIKLLRRHVTPMSRMAKFQVANGQLTLMSLANMEFRYHPVVHEDFAKSKYLEKILWRLTDRRPENYERLVATPGVGPKTVRALALVSEVVYGARPSYEDPARYSFAHGGKDATPYPVDYPTYDKTIAIMERVSRKYRSGKDLKGPVLEPKTAYPQRP
ncbi:MAG TPA: DUF763 domain-containing protein, partial [Candidatus Paceibacterota bacterium]|nr:DUF763 domain-containing protein [Candidatus Paceibacterota bacterium]